MTNEETKKRMPTWAKILITVVILGFVGFTGIVITTVIVGQKMYRESQDPVAIAKVANEFATFSEPLPADYRYLMGLSMFGIQMLTVEHKPDQQVLIMMSYPEKAEKDSKTLVEKIYESGINTPQASAKFESVKSKGDLQVGGQKMPYIIGNMTDRTGVKFQGLVGCIVVDNKKKSILVYGIQAPGKEYDLKVSEGFLKTIKSL